MTIKVELYEDLENPVRYFRESGKLSEKAIHSAINMGLTHLLYDFHDWCVITPFKKPKYKIGMVHLLGEPHSFEEWAHSKGGTQ